MQKNIIPLDLDKFKSKKDRIHCLNTHNLNILFVETIKGLREGENNLKLMALVLPRLLSHTVDLIELRDQIDAVDFASVNFKNGNFITTDSIEDLPVIACNDGKVVGIITDDENFKLLNEDILSNELPGNIRAFGNAVIISHDDDSYYSLYAHMKRDSIKVKLGDEVLRGDEIGLVGNTGNSTAPHLHFEMFYNNTLLGSIPKRRTSFDIPKCTICDENNEEEFYKQMEDYDSDTLNWNCYITEAPERITRESVEELDEYEIAYEKLMTKDDYKNTEIKNFDHFCNLCKTPEDTMKWFITNKVTWRNHDNKDKIYWPNDVINRKQGNCWDQSVLMHLYFEKKNIEHRMNLFSIVMEDGKRAGHIYPTFKRGNYIYIWAYLGVGVGFITGPYRDWYEAARMFTEFYKVLLLSDNSFKSVISDETEWSVQDYQETCRIDKRVGENISQQDYMLEDGGDNIWSTHFFSNDFRYIRIPKTKAILYKVYWWAKKHSEKNQDKPMKNENEIKPIKEEYSLNVYTKKYKTMDEFCKTFKTFDDVVIWFQTNHIKWPEYKESNKYGPLKWTGEVHWPEDLLRDKIGNCFDQALFVYYFCKKHNIPARMYRFSLFYDKEGSTSSQLQCNSHFVTMVKRKPGIFIFSYQGRDNDTSGPYPTYEKAAERYENWFWETFQTIVYATRNYYPFLRIETDKKKSRIQVKSGYFTEDDMKFFDMTYGDKHLTQNEYVNKSKGCVFPEDGKVVEHTLFTLFLNKVSSVIGIAGNKLSDFISSKESTEIIRPTDEDLRAIEYIKESFTDEEKEWFGSNNLDTPDNNSEVVAFIKVSYENGRPSGYVELTDSGKLGLAEGDVNLSFAVHKDFRGKGIAKQLIKEAVHWFKESNFTTMSFIVRKGNKASYSLAEKCGFVHMAYWEKTKEDWFMITNPTMLQAIGESSTETEQEVKSPMGICDSVIDYLGSSLDIEKFSDLKSGKRFMYTRCTVMKKDIPLILFLSYCEGLTTVLRKAGVRFMFSDTRPRLKGMDAVNKGVIPFSDGYIIYDKYPLEVSLLMNGLGIIDTKILSYSEMDSKDVYVNIFETVFGSRILANALDNFYECMIDPVTYTILEELNYPTEFVGLLLAGNKLLADNNFRDELDMANYRIRSNEMAYAYAYKQVATAYSKFRMTANNKNPSKISIPQSIVLKDIMQSQVVEDVSELSPIVEVEKSHILTDKGPSGTNLKEAYNIRRRCFHPSMTGIVAMSQSPDANVGINRAMTMNPNVIDARGIVPPDDEKDMDEVNLFGVAELLTPGSMSHDDPTRGSMSVKQAKHIVPVEAASPVLVSNGSEKVLPYHLSSDFVIVAKDDGKIISRDEKTGVAVIEYKNRQGKAKHQVINMNSKVVKNGAGGFYLVNTMNCDKLKKGSTFKKNDILAYNENFFSSSEAEGVRFNIGVLSKVACVSTYISFEDGDFVTDKLSKKLGTDVCMESTAIVGKNSNVSYIVKKGQEVNVNDPLIIYDDSTDDIAFNKMLANIGKDLKEEITRLGKIPVKSKYSGIIEDIKVYTTVEPKTMSPSLRKIVEEHFSKLKAQDAEIMKQTKDGGEEGFAFTEHAEIIDGGEDGKIMGVKVGEGVYFRFFIKYKDYLDVGDKLVHFTAMKYVNAEVVPKGEEPFSLNNPDEEISSIFAPGGVMARMTPSIFKTMYENKVIIELKRKWLEMYQKDNPSFKPKDELY